jgi:hypothetical protein
MVGRKPPGRREAKENEREGQGANTAAGQKIGTTLYFSHIRICLSRKGADKTIENEKRERQSIKNKDMTPLVQPLIP